MTIAIVRHKVKDYGKWRPVFDADKDREKAGFSNPRVYRSTEDKNEIVLIFDVADLAKAKAYVASPRLKEIMIEGGVADQPTAFFLESA